MRYFKNNKDKFPGVHSFFDDINGVGYWYMDSNKEDAFETILDFCHILEEVWDKKVVDSIIRKISCPHMSGNMLEAPRKY